MNEEKIIEENRLIGIFLGMEYVNDAPDDYPEGYYMSTDDELDLPYSVEDWEFHLSWDWLMKVVSKIESLESGIYQVDILQEGCKILKRNQLLIDKTVSQVPVNTTKIQSVYYAIVEFIKLYNNDE